MKTSPRPLCAMVRTWLLASAKASSVRFSGFGSVGVTSIALRAYCSACSSCFAATAGSLLNTRGIVCPRMPAPARHLDYPPGLSRPCPSSFGHPLSADKSSSERNRRWAGTGSAHTSEGNFRRAALSLRDPTAARPRKPCRRLPPRRPPGAEPELPAVLACSCPMRASPAPARMAPRNSPHRPTGGRARRPRRSSKRFSRSSSSPRPFARSSGQGGCPAGFFKVAFARSLSWPLRRFSTAGGRESPLRCLARVFRAVQHAESRLIFLAGSFELAVVLVNPPKIDVRPCQDHRILALGKAALHQPPEDLFGAAGIVVDHGHDTEPVPGPHLI